MLNALRHFYRSYIDSTLNIVLPPRCPMTGDLVDRNFTISPHYWRQLHFLHNSICPHCGAPYAVMLDRDMICGDCLQQPPIFHRARAVLRYDAVSAPMILKFKHADGTQLTPLFVRWMQQSGKDLLDQSDIVIPVPLHRWRLLKRRYNQAALLAQSLAKQNNITYDARILERIRATPPQGSKTTAQRFANTENAFTIRPHARKHIAGKTVLLIDDVYTSGATIRHCAAALLHNGAARVNVLTLARAGYAR